MRPLAPEPVIGVPLGCYRALKRRLVTGCVLLQRGNSADGSRRLCVVVITVHVYALPKNDRERDVPLPEWAAAAIRAHLTGHAPWPCTLPFETSSGAPQTHSLLMRWADGSYVRYRLYSEQAWKPALVAAGIIGRPAMDARKRPQYATTRKEGCHQMRHYYASVMLHGGVSIKELADYLGHPDAARPAGHGTDQSRDDPDGT